MLPTELVDDMAPATLELEGCDTGYSVQSLRSRSSVR